MIKEVPCMECDGKGFITKFGEYSVWSERCPNCGGTGIVKVPMTNADRIRAMDDDSLLDFFVESSGDLGCPPNEMAICDEFDKYGRDACRKCWDKYLKSPVEEG